MAKQSRKNTADDASADFAVDDSPQAESSPAPLAASEGAAASLPEPPPVSTQEVAPAPAKEWPEEPLPDDLRKALHVLNEVRDMRPHRGMSPDQLEAWQVEYRRRHHLICGHVAALQQGSAVLHIGADAMHHATKAHPPAQRTRWELKARGDVDFHDLLKAHDSLARQVGAITEGK